MSSPAGGSRRAAPRLAALVAAGLLAGCAGLGTSGEESPFRPGLWPVYGADRVEWAGVRETRAAGPLLHWESADGEQRFEGRPLYSSRQAEDFTRRDLFYPLAARRVDAQRDQIWLTPFGRLRRESGSAASERTLGLVFSGTTDNGESYSGIFPFFGTFRERLGFDRLRLLLWPLWARGEKDGYSETQVLWPLFALGRGDGRFKLRLWPFYGVERREGILDHRFALWPLVHWRRDHLDTQTPSSALYVLPIWGQRDRGPRHSRFAAFPLVAWQWHDTDLESRRLDLLWPIFSRASDRGTSLLALRPLWIERRSGDGWSRDLLLGLLGRTEIRTETREETWWRAAWFSRAGIRREGGAETRRVDIWPILRSARFRSADGGERGFLRAPWLIPLKGLEPDGWDRHYHKLFEVYGARWNGDERRSSILFGLRESRRRPDVRWTQWGGLFSYASD